MEQIMEINQSQDQTDKSQLKERLKSVLFPSLPEDNRIEKTAINTEQYKVEKKEELQTEITPVKKHDSIRKGKEADLKKLIALHSEKSVSIASDAVQVTPSGDVAKAPSESK